MAEQQQSKVALVEDDASTRSRFEYMIEHEPSLQLAGSFGNATDAMQWLDEHEPDVLLTDLGLPDRSGIEIIAFCARRWPECDIMVISVFGDEAHVIGSIQAGATGYVLKDATSEELADHIRELRDGGSPISPMIARQLLNRYRTAQIPGTRAVDPNSADAPRTPTPEELHLLTQREEQILKYIAKGFSFNEIAEFLSLSVHTVMTHVKRIYKKLAVHSRGEAVYEARQMGLLRF
jgi:DNA-binding NarL/FixJ family response regulator